MHLIGDRSNRMVIWAHLKITADDGPSQYDTVPTSAGHAASRDQPVHFGIVPDPHGTVVGHWLLGQADHPDASLCMGLCQPPSEAIIASASFGPQLPRL